MAVVTKVQGGKNATASGTTIVFTAGSLPTADNLLTAVVTSGVLASSVADNKGNTFAARTSKSGAGGELIQIFDLIVPAGLTGTYTVTATFSPATFGTLFVQEWATPAASPLDAASSAGETINSPASAGANVTTGAADFVVAGSTSNSGNNPATYTALSPFTAVDTQLNGASFGAAGVSSDPASGGTAVAAGSYTATWTIEATGVSWVGVSQSYKWAAAAATVGVGQRLGGVRYG